MDKISLHNNEIMHVSYSTRLEKVISYDKAHKAIVWDINTLKSCQVLIFESNINYLFPLQSNAQVLAIGSSSFLLEKVGLSEFLGDFSLWGATYDPNSKRFLVITNQEVRYLNFLKGDLERVFIHQRTDIYPNNKFHKMVKLRQGQQMFLSLNSQKQFCLYNFRTMQLYKAIHSADEHKHETPSAFFFIRELELLAVGYVESKIKGRD
jgi:WD40 repeat protein